MSLLAYRLFVVFFSGLNYETFRDDRLMFNQIIPYMGLMVTPVFLIFAATAIRMNIDKSDILINALIGTFVASNVSQYPIHAKKTQLIQPSHYSHFDAVHDKNVNDFHERIKIQRFST